MRDLIKYSFLAFVVTFAVFVSSSRYELIRYDDTDYVVENKHMREGLTAANVRWALTNRSFSANWHPLTWLSLMADVSVDRLLRGGAAMDEKTWSRYDTRVAHIMHFHNVVLHAANAALLLLLLMVLAGGRIAPVWALGLALLWALHPLRVEAVCWVTERKELLSVFFGLLTLLFSVCKPRSRTDDSASRHVRPSSAYLLSLLCFALALLSKSVVVSIPAVLLAWDWVVGGKIRWRRLVPFVLLSLGACYMTILSQAEAIGCGKTLPLSARLTMSFGAPIVYLQQTFWPANLSACYPETHQCDWILISLGVLLLAVMLAVAVRWLLKRGELAGIGAFAIAWVYVGLVPMLGIVKAGADEHCDRFTYWVGCGAAAAAALFIAWLKPRRAALFAKLGVDAAREPWWKLRRHGLYVFAVVLLALSVATTQRMPYWHDTLVLFRDAVPKCWVPGIASILANNLRDYGEAGRREGEWWLRRCASENRGGEADLLLAAYLLANPHRVATWESARQNLYAEEEGLVRGVLARYPNQKDARKLLKDIEAAKEKLK